MSHDATPEVHAVVHGDEVRVRSNLESLDSCFHEPVLGALAAHLGYELTPMAKGLLPRGGDFDPRYPELGILIERAMRDWHRWGDRLLKALEAQFGSSRAFPMDAQSEAKLYTLLREHRVGVTFAITGSVVDARVLKSLQRQGEVPEVSAVELAYRAGIARPPLQPPGMPESAPSMEEVTKAAMGVTLSPAEVHGLEYAKRRAGIYMRKPAESVGVNVSRVLNEAEYAVLRSTVAGGAERRWGETRLARELRDAVGSPSINNDMLRVARTELAEHQGHGAYLKLKSEAAKAGDDDPWVYKIAHPKACRHCRRIWGPMSDPRRYKLSEVEANDAGGGNFGRKSDDWVAVPGTIHPNCTEGPLQYYHPEIIDAVNAAIEKYKHLIRS